METMRAMVIERMCGGREATKVTDLPYPKCGEKQIIIKVMAASICKWCDGLYDRGMQGMTTPDVYPIVLGHEFAGEVVEVGSRVADVKVGDRVTVDNTVPCGECYYCQKDQPRYCDNFGSMGHNIHGGFEQYVAALGEKAFQIPEGVSYEEAACTEPVACCMHCIDRAQIQWGDNVAILGAGPMGMILAQLAKASGAREVVVLASTQSKLDLCEREFGVKTILVDRKDYSRSEKALYELYPKGANVIIDTTGSKDMVWSGVKMASRGCKLVWYTHVDDFEIKDDNLFFNREISIIQAWCQTHEYGRCIQAIQDGTVKLKPLITHEFSLEDYLEAIDENMSNREAIKVLIHPQWEKGRKVVHITSRQK